MMGDQLKASIVQIDERESGVGGQMRGGKKKSVKLEQMDGGGFVPDAGGRKWSGPKAGG
jgi:hypothetical protein